ncbi:MAG: transaldolase family protein [Planctomycetes bacterium]|nr:transaldolase family protein [Planctomycetota bacterium]
MTTMTQSSVPRHDSKFASTLREFCRQEFKPAFGKLAASFPSNPLWAAVRRAGSELWLDTGDVDEARALWCREFTALTTNNTLLNKEVQKGTYDKLVPRAAETIRKADAKIDDDRLVLEIAFILNAVHALKLVETFDAMVSVELHTALSHDLDASVEYGKRFHAICPERFYVKVPLTPSGCIAARRLSDAGVPLNFTLGFSARQNYLITLVARPAFVNVFMGRLNQFAADYKLNDGRMVGERATHASQRAVSGLRVNPQGPKTRQIGASMRSGQQVSDLVGLDVFTMPVKAAKEFASMSLPPGDVHNRMNGSFDVTWGVGVDAKADRLDVLWDVPDGLGKAMCKLYGEDLASFD